MIRAVLWDLDGTLLDFKAAESAAIKKCFLAFGFGECPDEAVARYSAINTRHWEMLERGECTRAEILRGRFEEFLASCGLDSSRAEDRLERLTAAKWKSLQDDPQGKLKLIKFALSRGYDYDAVQAAISKLDI